MPASKDASNKPRYQRSFSNEINMTARVYHPATNLLPQSPPTTPTGVAPSFGSSVSTTSTWGRQTSQNGKYS